MLKQYAEAKRKHPDALLIYRKGNRYWLYGSDCDEAEQAIELKYPYDNDKDRGGCFESDKLDEYLPKLVRIGKRVAILEKAKENGDEAVEQR